MYINLQAYSMLAFQSPNKHPQMNKNYNVLDALPSRVLEIYSFLQGTVCHLSPFYFYFFCPRILMHGISAIFTHRPLCMRGSAFFYGTVSQDTGLIFWSITN